MEVINMKSTNPHNNELIKSYSKMKYDVVIATIEASQVAFSDWKSTGFPQRSVLMKKAADVLLNNKDKYASLMTNEMGKPFQNHARK
jgi:succinate-semialdehyde dehydrogenase/glutarate-semialdehyde dehydrogenase